ncbi:MAG: endonuclease, partial [Marinobacter sp.]
MLKPLATLTLLSLTTPVWASDCGDSHTPVSSVQGAGTKTPLAGQRVSVEGVMTLDVRASGGFQGFYLQQMRPEQDDNPATSEGLFIHTSAHAGEPGDRVRVEGRAGEYYGLTSLSEVNAVTVCGSPGLPEPAAFDPGSRTWNKAHHRESLEGMLVNIRAPLVVTDTWNLARYGELVLAPSLQWVPTQQRPPGPQIPRATEQQDQVRLILDDGQRRQHPRPVPWPPGG